MQTTEITPLLKQIFSEREIEQKDENSWEIKHEQIRILVILSQDKSWLRILSPIAPLSQVQPLLTTLMEANFDRTKELRYAIEQNVLWLVFHHNLSTLVEEDMKDTISSMVSLVKEGLSSFMGQLMQDRIRQIIQAAKLQGQTKESTIQTITRFYEEGVLGDVDGDPQEREKFLAGWKRQLDLLWD